MREILFKGFNECENGTEQIQVDGKVINGGWFEGQVCTAVEQSWIVYDKDFYTQTAYASVGLKADRFCEIIPETVCQYTGLNKQDIKMWEHDRVKGKLTITANEEPYSYKRKIKKEREVFGTIVFKDGIYTIDWDEENYVFGFYGKPLYYYTYNATTGDRNNAITIPEQYNERSEISEIEIIGNKWEVEE